MTKILSAIANKNNVANLPQLAIASRFRKNSVANQKLTLIIKI